jgi:hypothetical protein
MRNTGVKCSTEELEFLRKLAERAATTPVIALSIADGLAGRDFASMAHLTAKQACHKLALEHGLPEIPGYYGIDYDGEFVEC